MPERIPQSATIRVPLQAYLSSDHVTPATGKVLAITLSKNGAAYGNPSAGATNAVEIASGSYYVDLSTTDTGTPGPLFVKGTEAATDNVVAIYNVANIDKIGYSLASTGLDSIPVTDPGGVATTFPKMMVQLWRRWFHKSTLTTSQLKTYADDDTTVRTTQTVSDDATTQTQGTAI